MGDMEDVEYAKLNHKKRRRKPQPTKPHLEDPTTMVYADIKTSHIKLPVEDPKLDVTENTARRFKCSNITKILILIILILSCGLAVSIYKHIEKPNDACDTTNSSMLMEIKKQLCVNASKGFEAMLMEIKKQLCVNASKGVEECVVCPNGWFRHRENCYNISSGGEYRTWNESREVCEEMGGHLLVIEDREQQEFINRSYKQQTDGRFWMGLYRDGDGWRWVDGGHYDISLLQISEEYSGDCVWWDADSGYNNDNCTAKHNWICQKRVLKI